MGQAHRSWSIGSGNRRAQQTLLNHVWQGMVDASVVNKIKINQTSKTGQSPSNLFPREILAHMCQETHVRMSVAVLPLLMTNWNRSKCPSTVECVSQLWYPTQWKSTAAELNEGWLCAQAWSGLRSRRLSATKIKLQRNTVHFTPVYTP